MRRVTVLVTAPEGYAQRFMDALAECKGESITFEPVSIPLICTNASKPDIAKFITEAPTFNYVVFTSRKAITVVSCYLKEKGIAPEAIKWPAACAIGKDNEALTQLGITPTFIAQEPSLKGIADELKARSTNPRIAVLGPRVENLIEPDTVPDFLKALHAMQATVEFYPAYITSPAADEELLNAESLLDEKIEWVAFTSATEAQVYRQLQHQSHPSIACFGPYTAHCVRKEGLEVDFVSADFSSFAAFALNMRKHIESMEQM